jgi:hypothetical protein
VRFARAVVVGTDGQVEVRVAGRLGVARFAAELAAAGGVLVIAGVTAGLR